MSCVLIAADGTRLELDPACISSWDVTLATTYCSPSTHSTLFLSIPHLGRNGLYVHNLYQTSTLSLVMQDDLAEA